MAVHSAHSLIHNGGLADGCERCAELAQSPLDLDKSNLRALIKRTLNNRFALDGGGGEKEAPRSDTEAAAMARIMTMLEQSGALFGAAPEAVAHYLADRWRINLRERS